MAAKEQAAATDQAAARAARDQAAKEQAAKEQAGEDRPDAAEEVGDSRQVAHQVVAVEPEERKELLRDRKMLQDDEQDEPMEARDGVQTPDQQHEDGVEIHTAQICS